MSESQKHLLNPTPLEQQPQNRLSLSQEERLRANVSRLQEKSIISTVVAITLFLFLLGVAYITAIFAFARASMQCGPAVLPLLFFAGLGIFLFMKKKSLPPQASARIVSFSAAAATDVLSANWDKVDYYSRLYVYSSAELAAHMHNNRRLLNEVLDERAELLGDFVDIEGLAIRRKRFRYTPVVEVCGILRCSKASVPITVLVNITKDEICLDGIKVDKRNAIFSSNNSSLEAMLETSADRADAQREPGRADQPPAAEQQIEDAKSR